MPLQENHGRIILHQGMSCWTPAQATFSTVSERIQGYLLTSPLPLLPHFSSVSLCPTSCVSSGITFPLSTPQLSGFTTTWGTALALNNACKVLLIRQCYSLFWFIPIVARNKYTVFALFSLQQVMQRIMVGWSQSFREIWIKCIIKSR